MTLVDCCLHFSTTTDLLPSLLRIVDAVWYFDTFAGWDEQQVVAIVDAVWYFDTLLLDEPTSTRCCLVNHNLFRRLRPQIHPMTIWYWAWEGKAAPQIHSSLWAVSASVGASSSIGGMRGHHQAQHQHQTGRFPEAPKQRQRLTP